MTSCCVCVCFCAQRHVLGWIVDLCTVHSGVVTCIIKNWGYISFGASLLKAGTKNVLCDAQTERDQLIATYFLTLLCLSQVSPCHFTVSVLCLKLAKFHKVWEGDLCAAIDLKFPLSGRVQLMSRLLRNEFSWLSDWNDVEPLWLEAKWSQARTYYRVLPKPNQSCSDSESAHPPPLSPSSPHTPPLHT